MHVGFQGVIVAVSSDVPEVMATLARIFAAMVVPTSTHPVAHIRVTRNGGTYHVSGETGGELENESLFEILRYVRFSVIRALIAARSDLLWLHAGAATVRGRAIV